MDPAILTYCMLMLKFQGKGITFSLPVHATSIRNNSFYSDLFFFFFNITVALRPGKYQPKCLRQERWQGGGGRIWREEDYEEKPLWLALF